MTTLMHWIFEYFLFAGTLFFAAGTPALTDAAATEGSSTTGESAGTADLGDEDTSTGEDLFVDDTPEPTAVAKPKTQEDPDAAEYANLVSVRIRGLVKTAPQLREVFKEHPEVQQEIEARFRREAGYRELGTIAELRQIRETFPNGIADVQAVLEDQQALQSIDQDFYQKDKEGNYSGHAKILNNMFQDDREATLNFLRTVPKEWHRLDRESYNEFGAALVGATLVAREIPDYLSELADAAKDPKNAAQVEAGLRKMLTWAQGFTKEKGKPSPEEERLQQDRQRFSRETQERDQTDNQAFHRSFVGESRKLQQGIITAHPAIQRLAKANIPEAKRNEIVEKVRQRIEKLLGKSPSFMRKLRPLHAARNLQEAMALQKAAWSDQRILNLAIRQVLRVETPALVKNSREAVTRRAGTPTVKTPVKTSENQRPTKPYQSGGQWYKPDGSRFSTAEIFSGKHLL